MACRRRGSAVARVMALRARAWTSRPGTVLGCDASAASRRTIQLGPSRLILKATRRIPLAGSFMTAHLHRRRLWRKPNYTIIPAQIGADDPWVRGASSHRRETRWRY